MHRFVVKFSKKIASCGKGALTPPNQNPADAAGHVRLLRELSFLAIIDIFCD